MKISQIIDEEKFKKEFGTIMRNKRKQSSYTIDEIIERSNYVLTNGSISKTERGCHSTSLYRALVLCETLDTDIETVLRQMGVFNNEEKETPAQEVYKILSNMNTEMQKKYLEIFKLLIAL